MVRKTFRDLRKNWISFLSVFLMSFICLFIFTGIFHLSQQMDAARYSKKYSPGRIRGFWCTGLYAFTYCRFWNQGLH